MTERRIPHCWIGSTVAVALMEPGGIPNIGGRQVGPRTLATAFRCGVLDDVTDLGIVGAFEDHDRPDADATVIFYPWSAVLAIAPTQ